MNEDELVISVPVTLDGVNRKKDRSVGLKFTSLSEISNEDFAVMDRFHQEAGHLLFRRNSFTNEDIPDEDVETDIAKSQSTQMRDTIWVLFKTKGGNPKDKESWNMFYRKQMQAIKNRLINEIRKLEEE